jgi:hypothetical protein
MGNGGLFYGQWVYISRFWYTYCIKKNLAILEEAIVLRWCIHLIKSCLQNFMCVCALEMHQRFITLNIHEKLFHLVNVVFNSTYLGFFC